MAELGGFVADLPSLWDGPGETADYPIQRKFGPLLAESGGMDSENKLAVLNLAAQYITDDEIYLEAGAWKGTSICAAATGNADKRFVTVDNFSQFGGPKAECEATIARWADDNVELVDSSIWEYLPTVDRTVGVWFYDARHDFRDQWRALEEIEPRLADEAIVIVDDASFPQVRAANSAFVKAHPRFEFIARFQAHSVSEPRWWNGLDVISYRRALPPADTRHLHRAKIVPLAIYGFLGYAIAYPAYLAKKVVGKLFPGLRRSRS